MIKKTKSGIFVRNDGEIHGLQIFSPFTGLFYSVPPSDSKNVLDWLNNKTSISDEKYINTIGLGWCAPIANYFDSPQKLEHNLPKKILVINWLITGKCTHACEYCYAHDLTECGIFDKEESIDSAIEVMLKYNPLAIVLSGGEPTLNPKIEYIISKLKNKVGIILDTNGCTLTPDNIDFFNRNNVVIRISLDTLIPKNNYRIPKDKKKITELENATINSINLCIEHQSALIIHTVVNDKNRNDLVSIGDKLNYLGVHVWKLIELVDVGNSNVKMPSSKNFDDAMTKINAAKHKWSKMKVIYQRTESNMRKVILITPIGEYCTQGKIEKILLDETNPKSPSYLEISKNILYDGHMRRYLDLDQDT